MPPKHIEQVEAIAKQHAVHEVRQHERVNQWLGIAYAIAHGIIVIYVVDGLMRLGLIGG